MIARLPGRIPAGEMRSQFTHVIDVVPTILELAGIPAPDQVNGIEQKPLEGVSFLYAVDDANAEERHRIQYFEIGGNRGIYKDGWTAVTQHMLPWPDPDFKVPALDDDTWELYGPDDWTQANNIAATNPEKLQELQKQFLIEASKYNVLPIDDRQRERFDPTIAGRPDLMAGRTKMTVRPGMARLNENTVLNMKNRSFTVTATLTVDEDPAEGAVVAQGGAFGGWCLYFLNGVPSYAHNYVGMEIFIVRADEPVGPGDHVLQLRFDYDGGGAGKGGDITFICDGAKIGKGRIEKTVPGLFSFDEGLDVGLDTLEPVVPDYATPKGEFNGTIDKVVIDIDPEAYHDPDLVVRARYRKQ
jgi:arylsulfatase